MHIQAFFKNISFKDFNKMLLFVLRFKITLEHGLTA